MNRPGKTSARSFISQELTNVIWSFATLNIQTAADLLDEAAPILMNLCSKKAGGKEYDMNSIAAHMIRQEAALLAWSCAVLNRYPSQLMPFIYTALFGQDDDPDIPNEAYGDGGLQCQAVMTMLYVSQSTFLF